MKRNLSSYEISSKRFKRHLEQHQIKFSNSDPFCTDEWMSILEFIEPRILFSSISLVSKSMYDIAMKRNNFKIDITNMSEWIDFTRSDHHILPKIKSLSVNTGRIRTEKKDMKRVVKLMTRITQLSISRLDKMNLMTDSFLPMMSLTRLEIVNSSLTDEKIAPISSMILLEKLILKNNNLTFSCVGYMKDLKSLNHIDLTNNGITSISQQDTDHFLELDNLSRLSISYNPFGPDGVKELVNINRLDCIEMNACCIGDRGATLLGNMKNIKTLHLESNDISDDSVYYLPESLTDLNLKGNNITDGGVKKMNHLKQLTCLSLALNHLTENVIGDILRFKNLSHIDLQYNQIPDSTVLVFDSLRVDNNSIHATKPKRGYGNIEPFKIY